MLPRVCWILQMEGTLAVKAVLMLVFFLEVTIFGSCVSGLQCFKNKKVMDLAMTFSGTLFLSIAMIDVIPEAIEHFDSYFEQKGGAAGDSSSLHQGKLPLTMIIAMVTLMVIMFLDKILIGHSHDHQYEISFVAEPRRNEDHPSHELKAHAHSDEFHDVEPKKQEQEQLSQGHDKRINCKPYILQLGMAIHAFFETLALGLQKNTFAVLSLATAILVHKWAEGLTLGLMYKKEGFKVSMIRWMVLLQGVTNVLGLLTGSILMGQGSFIMAFFMSMSAGTFLYISLAEVLQEQVKTMTKGKMVMILLANIFIAFIVWLEKSEEAAAEHAL